MELPVEGAIAEVRVQGIVDLLDMEGRIMTPTSFSSSHCDGAVLAFPCLGVLRGYGAVPSLGSEVAHRVSLTLATVRRSNRACRSPAHGFHEDANFRGAKEESIQPGQPAGLAVVQSDLSMNGPSWEPVRWFQSTSLL